MKPARLQLSRRRGFDLQAASRALNGLDAVNVARPSRWGNPWHVAQISSGRDRGLLGSDWGCASDFLWGRYFSTDTVMREIANVAFRRVAHEAAVGMYRGLLLAIGKLEPDELAKFIAPLKGKNLACWCPDHLPCHADVLLELANR